MTDSQNYTLASTSSIAYIWGMSNKILPGSRMFFLYWLISEHGNGLSEYTGHGIMPLVSQKVDV